MNPQLMTVSLTHAYEMVTTPIASASGATTNFLSTYVHMDTTAFDGTVTYAFEVVATNSNTTTDYVVSLYDIDGGHCVDLTVPHNTTTNTRIRTSFTPIHTGDEDYFIRTPSTASTSQVKVFAARLIISQVGATKTRLQIPLTTNNYAMTPVTADTAIMTTTSTSFVAITNKYCYAIWEYIAANWATVAQFRIEAVTKSSNASGTTTTSLNGGANTGTLSGAGTTVLISASTFQASYLTDGTAYAVQLKSSSSSYTASLYQANLYVDLSTISKAEIRQRIHAGISAATTGVATSGAGNRVLIDSIDNINSTFIEATGFCTTNGTALNVADMGTVDVSGTPSIITGSTINFNSGTDALVQMTPLSAPPTVGDRLYGESVTTAAAKTCGGMNIVYKSIVPNPVSITGASNSTSSTSGNLRLTSSINSKSESTSNTSANLRLCQHITGTVTSTSSTSGSLTDTPCYWK